MTRRAVMIGFACGVLIAGLGYLNDWVFRLNHIAGNHFPISVFGGLVVFSLGVNPLLRRVLPRAALGRHELAVVIALTRRPATARRRCRERRRTRSVRRAQRPPPATDRAGNPDWPGNETGPGGAENLIFAFFHSPLLSPVRPPIYVSP